MATQTEPQRQASTPVGELVPTPFVRPSLWSQVRDSWAHRDLFLRLGLRQIVKGYSGTKLGRTWLFLRPIVEIFGMALLFGSVLKTPSNGVPYLLALVIVMLPWRGFERTVFWGTRSFDIYRKVAGRLAVPKLLVPTAAAAPMLLEVAVTLALAIVTALAYLIIDGTTGLHPSFPEVLLAPAGFALAVAIGLGIALWTSVLNGMARDVRVTMHFILPVWLYITPVVYPVSSLPDRWQFLATINPVAAPVELFRQGLFGATAPTTAQLLVSLGSLLVLIPGGIWFIGYMSPKLLSTQSTVAFDDDEDEDIV
ncbi:MAG TPA: ABC transporter permease [Thermoleophilaceae bacterium]